MPLRDEDEPDNVAEVQLDEDGVLDDADPADVEPEVEALDGDGVAVDAMDIVSVGVGAAALDDGVAVEAVGGVAVETVDAAAVEVAQVGV